MFVADHSRLTRRGKTQSLASDAAGAPVVLCIVASLSGRQTSFPTSLATIPAKAERAFSNPFGH
jgi:hypothetical protein